MASGSEIIVNADPKGRFEDIIVSGTPKPGTLMELVPAQSVADATSTTGGFPVAGTRRRFQYRAVSRTAGAIGSVAVLLADDLQGKTNDDAYTTLTAARIYWPLPGDELNLLVGSVAGTADDVAVGDLFGINNDGKLKANSSYATAPFQALEVVTDPTADYLLFCKYLGGNA